MIQKSLLKKAIPLTEALKIIEDSGEFFIQKIAKEEPKISNSFLVTKFYTELQGKVDKNQILSLLADRNDDLLAIKAFQDKAKELGLTKKEANEKINYFIEIVFSQYSNLKLDYPPNSLAYLLGDGKWIIKKAFNILEEQQALHHKVEDYQVKIDKLCEIETSSILKLRKKRQQDLLSLYKKIFGDI